MGVSATAGGFSSAAGNSIRQTPFFARAAVGRLAELARFGEGQKAARVLNVEAGSGILTGQLARAGLRCWALDSRFAMAQELRRCLPQVAVCSATALAIPLRSSSIDMFCVGFADDSLPTQFDPAEAHRVLRTGGAWVQVWNELDESVPWVQEWLALLADSPTVAERSSRVLNQPEGFSDPAEESFANPLRSSVEDAIEKFRGGAEVSVMPVATQTALLGKANELLVSQVDAQAVLQLPLQTSLSYSRAI